MTNIFNTTKWPVLYKSANTISRTMKRFQIKDNIFEHMLIIPMFEGEISFKK